MDRPIMFKNAHQVTMRQKVGTAQNLYLSSPQNRGLGAGAAFTNTSTIQRPILIQTLNIDGTDDQGDITEITIAGLSLFVSDQSACLAAFSSKSFGSRNRSVGVSALNNQTVVVQGSLVNGGNVGVAIAVDPLEARSVKSPANQAKAYNFVFGLGTVSIPAGGVNTASLIATATRPCTLGEIILSNHSSGETAVKSEDVVIEDIRVAGLSMLCGQTGAQQIPLTALENSSSDLLGLKLSYPIEANARVEVVLRNYDGANACQVSGAILIEPWK